MKDLHLEALERYDEASRADWKNSEKARDDIGFLIGEGQWDEQARLLREQEARPIMTLNRMPGFLRQVTGDIRRINPAISVSAGDAEASDDVAELLDGMIRQIEYASGASSIYERAAESAAACGQGAWRIITDYATPQSFEQVIKIKSIPNPFAVAWDPFSREPDRSDANYCFVMERFPKKKFEKRWPKDNGADFPADKQHLRNAWDQGDHVLVAEYWYKKREEKTLYLTPLGATFDKPDDFDIIDSRKSYVEKVYSCKLSGSSVLEEPKEFVVPMIPIVACMGEEIHDGETIVRSSVIRYAKDAQRAYNYSRSTEVEITALQPKAPFIGTETQFEGYEAVWDSANVKNYARLTYNPDPEAPGKPERSTPPVASQGWLQQSMQAIEDMKATTGIYDAGLGNSSNETSGVAIRQRQLESDIGTSIYADNLSKSIAHCGRILVAMIPKIYDTPRIVRVIGADEVEGLAEVNIPGMELDLGEYAVRVATGPSYSTRRQESSEAMIDLAGKIPLIGEVAPDLIVKALDFPGADEVADRIRRALPPEIAGEDEADVSPEQQAMMLEQQQMAAQMQAQQEQLQQIMQELELRKAQADVEKAEAEAVEAEADAIEAQAKAESARINFALESGEIEDAVIVTAAEMAGAVQPL